MKLQLQPIHLRSSIFIAVSHVDFAWHRPKDVIVYLKFIMIFNVCHNKTGTQCSVFTLSLFMYILCFFFFLKEFVKWYHYQSVVELVTEDICQWLSLVTDGHRWPPIATIGDQWQPWLRKEDLQMQALPLLNDVVRVTLLSRDTNS